MKRIFAYLIVAAALALGASSCIKDVFPEGTEPTPALESEGIDIKIDSVSDNAFEFTLAPKGKSAYYSYLVTAAPAAPDSSQLYAVKYSGIKQGIISYKKTPRFSIQVEDLTPNHTYYVYAVAASEEGNVSPVVSVSVTTTDGVAPRITGSSYKGNVLTLKFSEPVTYVEGKEISAQGFPFLFPTGTPSVEKAVGKVVANGTSADVTFEDITQPGTLYVVNIPEGAFIDSVGQKTGAVSSAITGQDDKGQPVFAQGSIYGYVSAGSIEVDDEVAPATLVDWKTAVPLFKCKTPIAQIGKDAVTAKVYHEEDGVRVTSEYDLTANITYGTIDGYTVVAFLPEEPNRGDEVSFEIAEGAAIDIYGNASPELTVGPILYSYGFTVEDVLGTYQNDGASAYGATYNEDPWTFTVAKSDDDEAGNVMITNYYGLDTQIYAEWDGDAGTLTIPTNEDWVFVNGFMDGPYYIEYYLTGYYSGLASASDGRDIVLYMKEKGSFYDGNDYPGYFYYVFTVPESGNLEDITEANIVTYDYNVFMPEFAGVEEGGSSVAPASRMYVPMPNFARPKVNFTKVIAK